MSDNLSPSEPTNNEGKTFDEGYSLAWHQAQLSFPLRIKAVEAASLMGIRDGNTLVSEAEKIYNFLSAQLDA